MPKRLEMQLHEAANDAAIVAATNKTTVGGAITAVTGAVSDTGWIGVAGVVIALLGFLVNVYFQRKREKRLEADSLAYREYLKRAAQGQGPINYDPQN